jgi:diguanylate cyclase (GGDEF)-like protein
MQLFSELIAFQIAREELMKHQHRRVDEAEARIAEMQLITDLSGQCLAATSLSPMLDQTAQRLSARDTWSQVITFLMHDGKLTLDHDDPDGNLAGLISEIVQKQQHLLMQPDAFLLLTDESSSKLGDCRHHFGVSEDGSSVLITANDEDKVVGGIVLFGNRMIRTGGNESRLLRSCSNLLSLLATRLHDIELLHAANRQLAIDAMHDPLTGLPNRRYLVEEIGKMLSREARGGGALHVAFVDLDGFKKINDEHGHDAGDAFLIAIAKRLQSTARTSDIVARYGGDEFVVAATSGHVSNATDECYQVVNRLQTALGGRYELPGVTIDYAGPSIGCVSCSEENADIDELLKQADAAMYRVKQARKNGS